MSILYSIILLGIIQGITEFIPVSSSGHLILFNSQSLHTGPLLEIILHLGTLLSLLLFFRKSIISLFVKSYQGNSDSKNILKAIIIASIPTAMFGLFISIYFKDSWGSTSLTCFLLIMNGFILLSSKWVPKSVQDQTITKSKALLIGLMQCLAIFPGISRSGMTITLGLWLKIDKKTASEYSFFISIPIILGAVVLQIPDIIQQRQSLPLIEMILGIFISFIVGYFALHWLMFFIKKGKLYYFSFYCWTIGIIFYFCN